MRKFFRDIKVFFSTPPWCRDQARINASADACMSVMILCGAVNILSAMIVVGVKIWGRS